MHLTGPPSSNDTIISTDVSEDKVVHATPPTKIPCLVHIEGVDLFKHPMYRFFQFPKPTFLGGLFFKRQIQLFKKVTTQLSTLTMSLSSTQTPSSYASALKGRCDTCGRFRDISLVPGCSQTDLNGTTKLVDTNNSDDILNLVTQQCEKYEDKLPHRDSAWVACATEPHFVFHLSDECIWTTLRTHESSETVKSTYEDFMTWCMVGDDGVDSSLDGLVVKYLESIKIASL
jgi:hypothetical protein